MRLGPRTIRRAKAQRRYFQQIEAKARRNRDWILAEQAAELRRRTEALIRMR